jgi:predicted RNA-binding protein with PIN domain
VTVLIDGYNCIGRGRGLGLSLDKEGKEKMFLDLLARYRDRKGVREPFVVVFDGTYGGLAHGRTEFSHRGIRVEYAIGRSADEAIGGKVKGAARPRDLRVVSSDRAVERHAGTYGAAVQSADDFLGEVATALGTDDREKPEGMTSGDLEEWLGIFGEKEGGKGGQG